jgi:hypothetical protein
LIKNILNFIIIQLDKIKKGIESHPAADKYAKQFHEKTHIAPELLVVGLAIIPVIMLFFDIFAGAIW